MTDGAERESKQEAPLRSLVLHGFAWGIATNVVLQVFRIVSAVLLARLLTPHEYGIAAMALVFTGIVALFMDLSLGVGLVQRPQITESDRSTVFWTCCVLGVTVTGAGVALSGLIASFFNQPQVQPLFAVVSLTFLLGALGATHAALMQREMAFRRMNLAVGAGTIAGGLVGIGLAAGGLGPWALIGQGVCVAAVTTALLWLAMPWRPRFVYSFDSLRDLGPFGVRVLGVKALDFFRINGDNILIGKFLGSQPLGTYTVAFNILIMPIGRIFVVIMDTLLPAFSRLQSDSKRLASAWLRLNRVVAAVFVPALVGLAAVAPDFVDALLGHKWAAVTPVLQALCLAMIALVVTVLGNSVLTALGKAGFLLKFTLAEVALLMGGVAAGLHWGIMGVAVAYSAVTFSTRSCFVWATTRVLGVSLRQWASTVWGVAQATALMAVAVVMTRVTLGGTDTPLAARLALEVAVGVAVYIPVCLLVDRKLRAELAEIRRRGFQFKRLAAARS
jgi:O-antigen/teichoic acid export membrane protein